MRLPMWLRGVIAALFVQAAAIPAASIAASGYPPGTWWRVHWIAAKGPKPLDYEVTTRVKRWTDDAITVSIRNSLGQHWVETSVSCRDVGWWNRSALARDTVMGSEDVWVDGVAIPCRVRLRAYVGGPPCGVDPVSSWVGRTWEWIPVDTTLGGAIQRVTGAGATYYRNGRVAPSRDSTTWRVIRLHEPMPVGGQVVDCRVTICEPSQLPGTSAGRLVSWESSDVPTGYVRQIHEGRDPKRGEVVHTERRLVAFRIRESRAKPR